MQWRTLKPNTVSSHIIVLLYFISFDIWLYICLTPISHQATIQWLRFHPIQLLSKYTLTETKEYGLMEAKNDYHFLLPCRSFSESNFRYFSILKGRKKNVVIITFIETIL